MVEYWLRGTGSTVHRRNRGVGDQCRKRRDCHGHHTHHALWTSNLGVMNLLSLEREQPLVVKVLLHGAFSVGKSEQSKGVDGLQQCIQPAVQQNSKC